MAAKRRRGPAAPRPTKQHQDEASVPEPPRSCATRRGRVVAYLQRSARLSDRLQGLLDPAGQHHRARKRGASQRWRLGTAGLPLEHLRTGVRYDEQRLPQRQMADAGKQHNQSYSPPKDSPSLLEISFGTGEDCWKSVRPSAFINFLGSRHPCSGCTLRWFHNRGLDEVGNGLAAALRLMSSSLAEPVASGSPPLLKFKLGERVQIQLFGRRGEKSTTPPPAQSGPPGLGAPSTPLDVQERRSSAFFSAFFGRRRRRRVSEGARVRSKGLW